MTRPDPPTEPGGAGDRPSWMGAPGFVAHPDLDTHMPHAPMPGAPPYPADVEPPPPPVGDRATGTSVGRALGATAVWAVVYLAIVLLVSGPPPDSAAVVAKAVALVVTVAVAGAGTWLVARHRAWSFLVLVLVAAPLFWVLRALVTVPIG